MPAADPAEAGRKGGRSRSLKKLLAIRKNGFQPKPRPNLEQPNGDVPTPVQPVTAAPEKQGE